MKDRGFKTLACECGRDVQVSTDTVTVKCWKCVMRLVPDEPETPKEKKAPADTGFPHGWRWKKQFVHADGRVFEKGVENPALKGTIPPTTILSKFERRKLRDQKKEKKTLRLAKKYKAKVRDNARRPRSTVGGGVSLQASEGQNNTEV